MEAGAVCALQAVKGEGRIFPKKCHQFNVWGWWKRENISCERVRWALQRGISSGLNACLLRARNLTFKSERGYLYAFIHFFHFLFLFWEVLTHKTLDRSRTLNTETVPPARLRPSLIGGSDLNKGWMNRDSEQQSQIALLLQKHRSEFFCKQQITGYLLGSDLIITQIKEGRKWHEGETLLSLKSKVHFECCEWFNWTLNKTVKLSFQGNASKSASDRT